MNIKVLSTWKLSSGSSTSGFLGFGGGRGAALLGFLAGLGRVGGGSFFSTGAPSLSGIGARAGGGTWT